MVDEFHEFSISEIPLPSEIPLWLWKVEPMPGESLTSWVARLSAKMQIPMDKFLACLRLSGNESRADLEVNPPLRLIEWLAQKTGISETLILGMTLEGYLPRMIREQDQHRLIDGKNRPRHIPWVIPGGWLTPRYALRRNGGTPVCPKCAVEESTPFTPLVNRLSISVVCPRHGVPLRESCPHCGGPALTWALSIYTELSKSGFPFCWRCSYGPQGEGLTRNTPVPVYNSDAEAESIESILAFQELGNTALSTGEVRLPQLGRFSSLRYFQGLRHAITAFNALSHRGIDPRTAKASGKPHPIPRGSRTSERMAFDFQPINVRLKITAWMAWLTERPLDRWPHLYRISFLPQQLLRHWKHPWEAVEENGMTVLGNMAVPENLISRSKVEPGVFLTFFAVADQVGLSDKEIANLLGGMSERTIQRWRLDPLVIARNEHLQRMNTLVRIWAAIRCSVPEIAAARRWMRSPSQSLLFNGRSPLNFLLDAENPKGIETVLSCFGVD